MRCNLAAADVQASGAGGYRWDGGLAAGDLIKADLPDRRCFQPSSLPTPASWGPLLSPQIKEAADIIQKLHLIAQELPFDRLVTRNAAH